MTALVIGTTALGHDIWGGTSADLTALGIKPVLTQFQVIGGNLYESNGSRWNQISADGAVIVAEAGIPGALLKREMPYVSATTTRQRIDFGSKAVNAVKIRLIRTSGTGITAGVQFFLAVDAPSIAAADAMLANPSPDDGTVNLQRVTLRPDDLGSVVFERRFSAPIQYLDFLRNAAATEDYRIDVEGYA